MQTRPISIQTHSHTVDFIERQPKVAYHKTRDIIRGLWTRITQRLCFDHH